MIGAGDLCLDSGSRISLLEASRIDQNMLGV